MRRGPSGEPEVTPGGLRAPGISFKPQKFQAGGFRPIMRADYQINPERRKAYRQQGYWGDASIADWWRHAVLTSPDRRCVADSHGSRWTYKELDAAAARVAGWLYRKGVRKGDGVALVLPGWSEFTIAYVACLKIGAVTVPILPSWREAELSWALEKCEIRALFTATAFRKSKPVQMMANLEITLPALRAVAAVDKLEPVPAELIADGVVTPFSEILETEEPIDPKLERELAPNGDDLCAVLFTSGTEGQSKGVMLTHNNIIASERAYAARLSLTWMDAFLMPAPLGHATGFLHGVTLPMLLGAKSILLDIFNAEACLDLFENERATCVLGATPFVYDILTEIRRKPRDLSSLRYFLCGGTTIPHKIFEECHKLGIRLLSVYGSTESSPHSVVKADDTLEHYELTDGCPVSGVEVRVVDNDHHEVPHGEEGEEASRGPNVFVGYYDEPEITARALDADGWYYSGDLCRTDAAGEYIKITGRKKDIIVRGGENISSREIEDILAEHPSIRGAACVAMPDERLGERTCAYVLQKPGTEKLRLADIVAYFDARRVAKYKFPEYLVLVDEFPRTAAGKIRKADLRKDIRARLKKGLPSD